MDGVFLTEVDCPVGIAVSRGSVDTVSFDVVCVAVTVDGCTAVIVERPLVTKTRIRVP